MKVDRRKFLAGVAMAGAAPAVVPQKAPLAAPAPRPARASGVAAIRAIDRRRDRNSDGAAPRAPVGQLGFHGRRHQNARFRLPAGQSRVELPRAARVADRLRREQEARVPDLHARGIGGGDGARLFQGRRQAAADLAPWHRRPAARRDGNLQCLVRPRAGDCRGRHGPRRSPPAARRADRPLGPGHQRAGARF
jgi:hypothetical protein